LEKGVSAMKRWISLMLLLLGIASLFVMSGCQRGKVVIGDDPGYTPPPSPPAPSHEKGPPPWAPAHGYRAKHQYHYYPASYVYFDIGRQLYFYYQGTGWQVSARLPAGIRIDIEDYIVLEMETDKPYQYHAEVAKRYPPGQAKRGEDGNGKGKGKGKN
jgi:hypothetical protein